MPDALENVFGKDCRIHPITKRPLESGIGHLSDEAQARQHIEQMKAEGDHEAAAQMATALDETARLQAMPPLTRRRIEADIKEQG